MKDLISRVESAQESNRLLDCEIYLAFFGGDHRLAGGRATLSEYVSANREKINGLGEDALDILDDAVARYTDSIESALKLFPPNHYYLLGAGRTRPKEPLFGAVIYADADGDVILGQSESNTSLALAICGAALKTIPA